MNDPTATVDEFNAAYSGLRLQAKAHGIDTNTYDMTAFLVHQAECNAAKSARIRYLENVINQD